MKSYGHIVNFGMGLALVAGLLGSSAHAVMPSEEYACQVQGEGGRQGLVLVQTDNSAMAVETARQSTAITLDGSESRVLAVVQCIHLPEGRFSDTSFQQFFDRFPR